MILAAILWFLRRTALFRGAIDVRKAMIEECKRTGQEQRARQLAHEILVFEMRPPVYAKLLTVVGMVLLGCSAALHFAK